MGQCYFTFVNSTRHIMSSRDGEFEDDQQAEIFARSLLKTTDPSIILVEAWQRSRLVRRVQRD
jgi:hypothetical protein